MGSGAVSRTSILTVHVTGPKTFSISSSPSSVTVQQGGSATTQVTVSATGTLYGPVYIMAGNGPDINSGLKALFSGDFVLNDPQSGHTGGYTTSPTPDAPVTKTLTITAKNNAVLGTHTIWVNAHSGVPLEGETGDIHDTNTYIPVTVNVVKPSSSTQQSNTENTQTGSSGSPHVSASPSSAIFVHNIGVTSCPELISKINLQSDQSGTWSTMGNPSWTSVSIQDNIATINFNCQLSQYVTQTLSGDVEFMFTGSGGVNSVDVPISGQINKG
jgi:outer membrane lipoprotein-sorting protein